jgi:putative ABC transport system substrate-binding protein
MMKRRPFLKALTGAALALPLEAAAQPARKRIFGYLSARSLEAESGLLARVRQGLEEFGYVEGRNLTIEHRWADGQYGRLPDLAADLLSLGVEVLVTTGGPQTARAAQAATQTTPVVFMTGSDPVADGLVISLNRPGSNSTGVFVFTSTLGPKRLEILRELVPHAEEIAFLVNPTSSVMAFQIGELQEAARQTNQRLFVVRAGTPSDLDVAFSAMGERN